MNGSNVTWKSDVDNKLVTDPMADMEIIMSKRRRTRKRFNSGGYLKGPKHEQGGIAAIVGGNTPIEMEGGEYIMNAQTVEALGVDFMDKINSTATSYHTGGFEQGELSHLGSNYKSGGLVNGRNNMRRNNRRFSRGRGRKSFARGGNVARGRRNMSTRSRRSTRKVNNRTFRSGGRAGRAIGGRRPIRGRRFSAGGSVRGGSSRPNVRRFRTGGYNYSQGNGGGNGQNMMRNNRNTQINYGVNARNGNATIRTQFVSRGGNAITQRDLDAGINRVKHSNTIRSTSKGVMINGKLHKLKP